MAWTEDARDLAVGIVVRARCVAIAPGGVAILLGRWLPVLAQITYRVPHSDEIA